MSKYSAQRAAILGALVFNVFERNDRLRTWCQECGDEVDNIDYQGNLYYGTLELGITCDKCRLEDEEYISEQSIPARYWIKGQ